MMTETDYTNYLRHALAGLSMRLYEAVNEDMTQTLLMLQHQVDSTLPKPIAPTAVAALKKAHEEQVSRAVNDPFLQRLQDDVQRPVYDWLAEQNIEFDLETHGAAVFVRFQDDADAALFRLRWG